MMQKAPSMFFSWLTIGGMALLATGFSPACSNKADIAYQQAISDILAQTGPGVVEPALSDFVIEAEALREAVIAWSDAPDDAATLSAAQQQWAAAMSSWQRVEVMQIGPTASSLDGGVGEDLRGFNCSADQ